MLTARDAELDKVSGLEAGVDDYIIKLFSVLEFQARVRNVLRRVNHAEATIKEAPTTESVMSFGGLTIQPGATSGFFKQPRCLIDRDRIHSTPFLSHLSGASV